MAIYGIGTDLVQVSRIAGVMERTKGRFAEKVLGADELRVYHARKARSDVRGLAFLATRFSAKEAFSKAIGLGMHWPMTWRAVQTLNEPSGKPIGRRVWRTGRAGSSRPWHHGASHHHR